MHNDFICPLCQTPDHSPLHRTSGGFTAFNRNRADFYLCDQCGLVFRLPMPDSRELVHEFYEVEYWRARNLQCHELLKVQPHLIDRLEAIFEAIGERWDEGTIIDVGCGFGHLAATLAQLFPDCRVIGLEPDLNLAKSLQTCKTQQNIEIVAGSLESFNSNDRGTIVAAYLSTVFEHIFDPVKGLQKLHRMLAPGGWLVIELPDVMEPGVLGLDYFFRDFHLFYYSDRTLSALLNQCGFEVCGLKRGGVFRTATAPTLCVAARKIENPPEGRKLQPDLSGEPERIRERIRSVRKATRLRGPINFIYRYRIRMPLLKLKSAIRKKIDRIDRIFAGLNRII